MLGNSNGERGRNRRDANMGPRGSGGAEWSGMEYFQLIADWRRSGKRSPTRLLGVESFAK